MLDREPGQQYGILCDTLVNALRGEIPPGVERIVTKAVAITVSEDQQQIVLSNEATIPARLVVLASASGSAQ